jgi:hypothetical protein
MPPAAGGECRAMPLRACISRAPIECDVLGLCRGCGASRRSIGEPSRSPRAPAARRRLQPPSPGGDLQREPAVVWLPHRLRVANQAVMARPRASPPIGGVIAPVQSPLCDCPAPQRGERRMQRGGSFGTVADTGCKGEGKPAISAPPGPFPRTGARASRCIFSLVPRTRARRLQSPTGGCQLLVL